MKNIVIILFIVCGIFSLGSAQSTITLSDNDTNGMGIPSGSVGLGETLTILAGDCPVSNNENFIVIESLATFEQIVIDISAGTAEVVLPELGDYVINCGCPAPIEGLPLTCAPAANVTVVDAAPIPTLGEWGLMIASILILIVGVVAMNQSKIRTALRA